MGAGATVSGAAVDRVLAVGIAVTALGATVLAWQAVGARQVIHPLTLFYLLEAPSLALVGAWGLLRGSATLPWTMAGALFGFCIIGGFSIGPAYLAADGLLGAAALWRDRRAWRLLPGRVGLALLAAIIQAVMMLTLIRVLH